MANDFQIRGAEQLEALGRRLKGADKLLVKELRGNIRKAVAPVKPAVQQSLRSGLPKSGGLAKFMGNASVGVRTSTGGKNVGVRILAQKKGHDLASLDRGEIRHLVYGHKPWISQRIAEGLVSDPVDRLKPQIGRGVLDAMAFTSKRLTS